jgi:peptide-methionine (S)-S-oxide reductase
MLLRRIAYASLFTASRINCALQSVRIGNQASISSVPMSTETVPAGMEVATVAGGCFWCIEAVYSRMKGVSKAESGYTGGHTVNPTYKQVSLTTV